MRRYERPKRRFAVWALDIIRIALGYAGAEVFLILFIIPYSGLLKNVFLPGSNENYFSHRTWDERKDGNNNFFKGGWNGVHNNDQENLNRPHEPSSNEKITADKQSRNYENQPRSNRGSFFTSRFFYLQSTSLTLSFLEIFPGMFFIFGLYWIFLYLFYVVVLFWKKTLRSPRVIFRRRRRCLPMIVRDPILSRYSKSTTNGSNNDRFSRQKLGFVSGFYGFPIKIRWFSQQMICFMAAVLLTRIIIMKLCQLLPHQVNGLRTTLFVWNTNHVTLKMLLLGVLIPALMYIVQFCVADLVMKFRSKAMIKYSHDRELQPMFSTSNSFYPVYSHNDEYELQELTLPILVSNERETEMELSTATITPTNGHENQNSLISHERESLEPLEEQLSPHIISLSNDDTNNNSHQSAVVSGLLPIIHDTPSTSSLTSGRKFDKTRPQLGIVTASLLNAAAVTATATTRSNIFNLQAPTEQPAAPLTLPGISASPSQLDDLYHEQDATVATSNEHTNYNNSRGSPDATSPSTSTTVSEATGSNTEPEQHNAEEDNELYSQLPSYDDSERQQRELLRDPEQACRHQTVINGMKR